MRRVLLAVFILLLPAAASIAVYLIVSPGSRSTPRDAVGVITTIAGTGAPGAQDGPASSARFSDPFGIAIDGRGNVFVADGGESNRIRVIVPSGRVETVAGSSEGFADGKLASASFNTPSGLAIDKKGNVIIADTSNNRIRRLAVDGQVTTVAGDGEAGINDGPASAARFDGPIGVAVDDRGNIYVADSYNDCIRRIAGDGSVSTLAGSPGQGFVDGSSPVAKFDTPCGLAVDREGNLFVADTGNDAIRKISPAGEVTTFAGGKRGRRDGNGTEAAFNQPTGIALTHDGYLFVSDAGSGSIRRITPQGEVATYAGASLPAGDMENGHPRLNSPSGIAVDRQGEVFVCDAQSYVIRRISPRAPKPTGASGDTPILIQPLNNSVHSRPETALPNLGGVIARDAPFHWPLSPQDGWHEITGLVGEARGAPGGIALDHLHSGVDIRGNMGDPALSVLDEKVSSPIPDWDCGGSSEGIHIGLMSYIHIRVGRDKNDLIHDNTKFKGRFDESGALLAVRVRRGARFRVGDFIGTLNSLYHVHLNLGPWDAEVNPIGLPFPMFADTIPPVVEANGIELLSASGDPLKQMRGGRVVVAGDVDIVVEAYDKVDGNTRTRKLGLYKVGYQVLREDGSPALGFEEPVINIEFNRLPPNRATVLLAYAPGSGVSAYGGVTRFRYIVTNRLRDGEAADGVLRTSELSPGNYTLKIIAEDFAGNRATGPATELALAVVRP